MVPLTTTAAVAANHLIHLEVVLRAIDSRSNEQPGQQLNGFNFGMPTYWRAPFLDDSTVRTSSTLMHSARGGDGVDLG